MMKKIKIAQIGMSVYGHGKQIWESITKQKDIFEVVGYALPENEEEKFPQQVKAFEGYRRMTVEELLANPDIKAVAVETEEIYITKYALMVAEAGKHLHMEKPGGIELADFERLIEILKSKKLVFSTGYMYRFNPKIQEALARVKAGELGEIYSVEAQMSCTHPTDVRQWLSALPSGMLFFLGCHLIDLIYQIQGEPEAVIPLSTSTGFDGIFANDYGMVVFQYKNGVSFAKTCDTERGGFQRRQLVICGERGTFEIKPLEILEDGGRPYTVMSEAYTSGWHWKDERVITNSEAFDRYDAMLRNFAELVRGKENPYSYDYELGLYRLILRACERDF